VLAHFFHHVPAALPPPLLPLIRDEFNLSYARAALISSSFAWVYGIAQIPAGFLADRFGPRIMLIIGIIGVGVAGILVGLSNTYVLLLVFMGMMGVVGGGYHPAAAPMVSAAADPEKRGRALGFHEMGASAAFLVAPFIAAGIASVSEWRISFISLAVPTLIFGIYVIRYTRRSGAPSGTYKEPEDQAKGIVESKGRMRRLVAFLLLSVLSGGIVSSVSAFITLYAVDNFQASTTGAASLYVLMNSAGIWVSPIGGYLSDRLGRVPLIISSCLLSAFVVYMLNWAPYYWGVAVLMLLSGVAMYTRMPVSEAYIIGQTTERNRSLVYGIYYFSMTESGAIFAPIMGFLMDIYGFSKCFTWASVAIIVVILIFAPMLKGSKN